jgi:hypothetical protein
LDNMQLEIDKDCTAGRRLIWRMCRSRWMMSWCKPALCEHMAVMSRVRLARVRVRLGLGLLYGESLFKCCLRFIYAFYTFILKFFIRLPALHSLYLNLILIDPPSRLFLTHPLHLLTGHLL